jgi:hypothetical protein
MPRFGTPAGNGLVQPRALRVRLPQSSIACPVLSSIPNLLPHTQSRNLMFLRRKRPSRQELEIRSAIVTYYEPISKLKLGVDPL